MYLFSQAVKAGNASAKVTGPGLVQATSKETNPGNNWPTWFTECAAVSEQPFDGISFHAYDTQLGDLTMMRINLG